MLQGKQDTKPTEERPSDHVARRLFDPEPSRVARRAAHLAEQRLRAELWLRRRDAGRRAGEAAQVGRLLPTTPPARGASPIGRFFVVSASCTTTAYGRDVTVSMAVSKAAREGSNPSAYASPASAGSPASVGG